MHIIQNRAVRLLLKGMAIGLALTAASGIMAHAEEKKEDGLTQRHIINFNTGWLYSANDYTNAQKPGFDDSGFEAVSVPHANKILEKHKGPGFQSQIDSYRFVSWYRRHFQTPDSYRDGRRILVEFEGVATVAQVYVNGSYVGEHKGAYTGFSYDITDYLNADGSDNVIAVRVDSTKRTDIPPEGGSVDYCLFGGIVRDVHMIVTGNAYVDNVFLTTPELEQQNGTSSPVHAETTIINKSGNTGDYSVAVSVMAADGTVAARSESEPVTIAAGNTAVISQSTESIADPHLWSGDDPYLYTVLTQVKQNGVCIDDFETTIGFRWFRFHDNSDGSGDASLYLNGKKIPVIGINRHEQWPWIGRAVVDKLQARDADLIRETGFNAVRCSHYPQDPAFLNRCDELGLIVFEEAPGWQYVGDSVWQQVYKENIREMIVRDRNHPSILSWGVRVNESNDNDSLYQATNQLARELDPTRPTHGARRQDTYANSHFLEDLYTAHYTYPETPRYTPFLITEHSWDCWTNGFGCPWATDEQALAFTKDFADKVNYYLGNPLCAGGFAWSMFDYDNEVNYTRTNNVFYSGLYDIFRLPKPAANLYRSQKDPAQDPMVYIANYWDDDAKPLEVSPVSDDIAQGGSSSGNVNYGEHFSVTVMSNCDTVELYINGNKSDIIPARQYRNLPHPFFVFDDVPYEAGEVKAIGYVNGVKKAEYVQKTPGTPVKLIAEPDDVSITADGADFTSVAVRAVDANGTEVPGASDQISISVEGAGKFIGEETIALEGGRTAFFVQSKYNRTGTAVCRVRAEGMEEAVCEIEITPFDQETVPVSDGTGTERPVIISDINDTNTGMSLGRFRYEGSGWASTAQNGCYFNDNHYSNTAGDICSIEFVGTNIKWYGSKASNHGILAVSVDGKAETRIDCYAQARSDNVELFDSGELPAGIHTLTVRVTGERNSAASNCYVNVDRVRIQNDDSVQAEEKIYYFPDAVHSAGQENNGDVVEWMVTSAPQYFYIDTIDFDRLRSVILRSGYEIHSAVTSLYAYDNGGKPVTEEQLRGFCSDPSALGASIGEIADQKTAQWGYRSAKLAADSVEMGEGGGFYELLPDQSKPLTIPEGTGEKALIVGISGDIGSRAYFDHIVLQMAEKEGSPSGLSFSKFQFANGTLEYELAAADDLLSHDIYIAVYEQNRLAAVSKNTLSGSFSLKDGKSYTVKVFVWDGMAPVTVPLTARCG